MPSPVALFVYNRADNTRRTIEALLANTLATQTDLYVFSDGGRDEESWRAVREVRTLLHEVEAEVSRTRTLNSITIVERPTNYYLERNIIEGINQVFEQHDTIIVLEDDIVTAPHFLQFMNDAFRLYKDDKRVMHVSGFTRIEPRPARNEEPRRMKDEESRFAGNEEYESSSSSEGETHSSFAIRHSSQQEGETEMLHSSFYFSPFMAGWGWGTWRDRWNGHFLHFGSREEALKGLTPSNREAIEYGGVFPCLKDLDRSPIPWDICWSIAIRQCGGLCLYPTHTLVRNIGLTGGTHYGLTDLQFSLFKFHFSLNLSRLLWHYDYDREPYEGKIEVVYEEPAVSQQIEAQMHEALTDWGIRYTWLGRVLRFLYQRIKGRR